MLSKIIFVILVLASFLRLWNLDQMPVSMFGDELDVGYHAYSILKTGQDYSGNSWPLHFQSLAEWRTPLYLYSAVPTVALFDITPLGVRLPAAIFGILSIWAFYLLVKQMSKNQKLALLAAFLLTISPWHIQYSRAAFEVTQLLFFLLFGLYAFFKSLEKSKWLAIAGTCFALMPWVYSTAKLFTPMLLAFLVIFYSKQVIRYPKRDLYVAAITFAIFIIPITLSTIFGGGTQRFGYVSVFTDPTIEQSVGKAREVDSSNLEARLFHNKYTFSFNVIERNFLQSFSTDFLFNEGDPNLRHSISGIGQLYRLEFIPLILGIVFFFVSKLDRKYKLFLAFWLLAGVIPAAITRDGGMHATRLILILPPLVFLVAFGLYSLMNLIPKKFRVISIGVYSLLLIISFTFYQHNFWTHNTYDSERWWHYGWREAIQSIKQQEGDFEKVIVTSADEPPWIFFAAHYQYDPIEWHEGYPFKKTDLENFGQVSYINKYYFAHSGKGIYDLGKMLDDEMLYLASAKEVNVNLIAEPERTPQDLNLLKSIAYPSGEPAFYLFSKK